MFIFIPQNQFSWALPSILVVGTISFLMLVSAVISPSSPKNHFIFALKVLAFPPDFWCFAEKLVMVSKKNHIGQNIFGSSKKMKKEAKSGLKRIWILLSIMWVMLAVITIIYNLPSTSDKWKQKVLNVRVQHPQYHTLSDKQLIDLLYSKYYSDIPKNEYYKKLGYPLSSIVHIYALALFRFFVFTFPVWLSWLIYWAYIGFPISKISKKREK